MRKGSEKQEKNRNQFALGQTTTTTSVVTAKDGDDDYTNDKATNALSAFA